MTYEQLLTKWWYRLLKVIGYFIGVFILLFTVLVEYDDKPDLKQVDLNKTLVQCLFSEDTFIASQIGATQVFGDRVYPSVAASAACPVCNYKLPFQCYDGTSSDYYLLLPSYHNDYLGIIRYFTKSFSIIIIELGIFLLMGRTFLYVSTGKFNKE